MSIQRTSGKYGTIQPRIRAWEFEHTTRRPRMSAHLLYNRWDKRTTWDSCSPEFAWDNGINVSHLSGHDDLQDAHGPPDSAVYFYEETGQGENEVVLVERNGVVTTVLLVSWFCVELRVRLRNLWEEIANE